jgi:hypothetical protein
MLLLQQLVLPAVAAASQVQSAAAAAGVPPRCCNEATAASGCYAASAPAHATHAFGEQHNIIVMLSSMLLSTAAVQDRQPVCSVMCCNSSCAAPAHANLSSVRDLAALVVSYAASYSQQAGRNELSLLTCCA